MEAAAEITVESGLPGLSLDRVARRAGVSKGGLIHHYPNKQSLIRGLFQHVLDLFGSALGEHIAADPCPRNRFTRAYVAVAGRLHEKVPGGKLFGACALAMSLEPSITMMWKEWLRAQLERFDEDPECPVREMLRFTADGIWISDCTGMSSLTDERRKRLVEHLMSTAGTCENESDTGRPEPARRAGSEAKARLPRGAATRPGTERADDMRSLCSMLLVAHYERGKTDLTFAP